MAAAREQAARILRAEPDSAEDGLARDVAAAPVDTLRAQLSEETVARRPMEAPVHDKPVIDQPAAAAPAAAPKSGKRKFVLIGVGALLALAAASYGVHYVLFGRFMISTDDAYVRANNTTLGARVSGHIAAILPDDTVV